MKVHHEWFAVIRAPDFRLQAASLNSANEGPYALAQKQGAKMRVVECNHLARKQQVTPGLTTVQALVRCPYLRFVESTPQQEEFAQQLLIRIASHLTPFIESTDLGRVTLALPEERSWIEDDLLGRLVAPLKEAGLSVQVGMARNAEVASLASCYARAPRFVKKVEDLNNFLMPLPIEVLQPSIECIDRLASSRDTG